MSRTVNRTTGSVVAKTESHQCSAEAYIIHRGHQLCKGVYRLQRAPALQRRTSSIESTSSTKAFIVYRGHRLHRGACTPVGSLQHDEFQDAWLKNFSCTRAGCAGGGGRSWACVACGACAGCGRVELAWCGWLVCFCLCVAVFCCACVACGCCSCACLVPLVAVGLSCGCVAGVLLRVAPLPCLLLLLLGWFSGPCLRCFRAPKFFGFLGLSISYGLKCFSLFFRPSEVAPH